MPDPQARRLCGDHPVAAVLDRAWEPVLALAGRWPERTWDDVSPSGRFDGAFVNDDPAIGWIADDGRRRGDDAPGAGRPLDARAAPPGTSPTRRPRRRRWSQAVRRLLDLGEPDDVHVHRWTFARPVGEREASYALVDGPTRSVGVCGDGWGADARRSRRRGSPAPGSDASWSTRLSADR